MYTSRTTCTKSIDMVNITDIQDDSTADDLAKLNTKVPIVQTCDTHEFKEYTEMRLNIRNEKNDIMSFSQTLNYGEVRHIQLSGGS
eukprot:5716742-Amphidinium_carterae.2